MNTGQRISERRRLLSMSQEELAFKIGTNQRQVSRYEREENDPTGDVLVKLADALNTTTDWLLGITQYPERGMRGTGDLDDVEIEALTLLRTLQREERDKIVKAIKALTAEV